MSDVISFSRGMAVTSWGPATLVKTRLAETTHCCDRCEGHDVFEDLPPEEWWWRYAGPVDLGLLMEPLVDDRGELFAMMSKLGKEGS